MSSLNSNTTFAGKYILLKKIGFGGFSEVWKVQRDGAVIQALKIFTGLDSKALRLAKEEFLRVSHLNHHRIMKPVDYGIDGNNAYLVMPFYKNGNAQSQIGKLSEKQLAKVLFDIASALGFLHGLDDYIIHQDIKPDNFLIDDEGNYILTDFGISKRIFNSLDVTNKLGHERMTQRFGGGSGSISGVAPIGYRPPETFSEDYDKNNPIKASDIWSLGATIFEMATGNLPFGMAGGAMQGNKPLPDLPADGFSDKFNSLIKSCLQKDPWDRPAAEELKTYCENFIKYDKWTNKLFVPKDVDPPPAPARNKLLLPSALVTVAALVAAFLFYNKKGAVTEPVENLSYDQWVVRQEEIFDCWYDQYEQQKANVKSTSAIKIKLDNFDMLLDGLKSVKPKEVDKNHTENRLSTLEKDLEKAGINLKNCK